MTNLEAMSLSGMVATMTIKEPADADIVLAFVEQVLSPKLTPGDVVVIDNLSSHKVNGVRRSIESAGAEPLYLSPYWPDFNPIEKTWVKFKQLLRSAKPRCKDALENGITEVLKRISIEDAKAWFRLPLHRVQLHEQCSKDSMRQRVFSR